jgi:hypothetical protein
VVGTSPAITSSLPERAPGAIRSQLRLVLAQWARWEAIAGAVPLYKEEEEAWWSPVLAHRARGIDRSVYQGRRSVHARNEETTKPPLLGERKGRRGRERLRSVLAQWARWEAIAGAVPLDKEEEVESDRWRSAEARRSSSLRATLPDSAGRKPSEIPSEDSGQFPFRSSLYRVICFLSSR